MYGFGNPEINISTDIATVERRIKNKQQQVEDVKNEYDLLMHQEYDLLRYHILYSEFVMIKKAYQGFYMLRDNKDSEGKKLDKRKKYSEIESLDWLKEQIEEYLKVSDIEITDFYEYNYGEAFNVFFTYLGHTWIFEVPIIKMIKFESFERYGSYCFKLRIFHEDNKSLCTSVGTTFDVSELKDIMKKGIETYIKKEGEECQEESKNV